MGFSRKVVRVALAALALCVVARAADFEWNWRDQQTIGRTDPSVGNTSRLTEPERTALIDAIVLRLQKPMSEHGYDDERIREIASTTRTRFVDLGGEKPLLFATSLGLEGGCDALSNCPLWIFRHTEDGYVSVLDAVASSYTVQPTSAGALSDLVLARNESSTETHLSVYTYADGKYSNSGCYFAKWPGSKESEIQDPDITACNAEASKSGQTDSGAPAKADDSNAPKADDSKPTNSQDSNAPKADNSKPTNSQDSNAPKADDSKPTNSQDSNAPKADDSKPTSSQDSNAPKADDSEPTNSQDSNAPKADDSKPANSHDSQPASAGDSAAPKPDDSKPANADSVK